MKTIIKINLLIFFCTITFSANAQPSAPVFAANTVSGNPSPTYTGNAASASANICVTIVSPITISKVTDMNFGNVAISSTVSGTVVISPAGARIKTGGVTLPLSNGTVTAASFMVRGERNCTYTITLPDINYVLTRISGFETMTVNTFTSSPSETGALSNDGSQTINVGATLNVNNDMTPGIYTNDNGFEVTVNYN